MANTYDAVCRMTNSVPNMPSSSRKRCFHRRRTIPPRHNSPYRLAIRRNSNESDRLLYPDRKCIHWMKSERRGQSRFCRIPVHPYLRKRTRTESLRGSSRNRQRHTSSKTCRASVIVWNIKKGCACNAANLCSIRHPPHPSISTGNGKRGLGVFRRRFRERRECR